MIATRKRKNWEFRDIRKFFGTLIIEILVSIKKLLRSMLKTTIWVLGIFLFTVLPLWWNPFSIILEVGNFNWTEIKDLLLSQIWGKGILLILFSSIFGSIIMDHLTSKILTKIEGIYVFLFIFIPFLAIIICIFTYTSSISVEYANGVIENRIKNAETLKKIEYYGGLGSSMYFLMAKCSQYFQLEE